MKYILSLLLISLSITACKAEPSNDRLVESNINIRTEVIADELEHPWAIGFLPNNQFLVTERSGRMQRISRNGDKTEINGVPPVFDRGQGGLLDVTLDKDFTSGGGTIYFSFAAVDPENPALAGTEVARANLNLETNTLENVTVIFRASPKVSGNNHWGSRLRIGPDGLLYIGLGDRFNYRDQAQDLSSHNGAVIRITTDGKAPENNPFFDTADALPEIFTIGHRNIQGMTIHPTTGEIWTHEHGPKGGDEINIIKAGENYGWPEVSFGRNYSGTIISDVGHREPFTAPVLHWTPAIAPSGMTFYTGDLFPSWRGDLFIGSLVAQHLRRVRLDGENVMEQEILLEDFGRIRDVAEGTDGALYIITDDPEGKLVRLVPK